MKNVIQYYTPANPYSNDYGEVFSIDPVYNFVESMGNTPPDCFKDRFVGTVSRATHLAFVDENGDSYMGHIFTKIANNETIKDDNKFFNITSILIECENFQAINQSMLKLKYKYWEKGEFDYSRNNLSEVKRVCFHSRDIRRKEGPFSTTIINYDSFLEELDKMIIGFPFQIYSAFFDKELHARKYERIIEPYSLALSFILERLIMSTKDSDRIQLILESRGNKEDWIVLNAIEHIFLHGTTFLPANRFKKIIAVYFNKKRFADGHTLFGLELADLCSYPIYNHFKNPNSKNRAYDVLKPKIYGYPQPTGRGLKKFP